MHLDNDELGNLSNHLGHSDNVHKTYYRLQESVIEKTCVVPLLNLVNNDQIAKYSGKKLNQVPIEDLISAAHKDVNAMDDDDLDDDFDDNIDFDDPSPSTSNMSPSRSTESLSISNFSQSTSTANVVIENNVSLPEQKPVKRKVTRAHWPKSIKDAARRDLADCIHDIMKLTFERAVAFLKTFNYDESKYKKFRQIIYNMGCGPRSN